MRKYLAFFLLIVCTFLAQLSIAHLLPLSSAVPNLLLVLTVSIAFMRGRHAGVLIGFFCGLLADIFFGGGLFGLRALIYLYIGFFCGFFGKTYFDRDLRLPLLLVAVSDFAYGLLRYVAEALLRRGLNFPIYLRRTILPEVIASVLLAIFLYPVYLLINRRISAREIEEQNSPWLRR